MLREEWARVFAFFTAVAVTYVQGAKAAFRWGQARRWSALGRVERLFLLAAAAGTLCIAYGRLVEPFWPEVTRVRLTSPKLKGATRPIRLVLLSDLHSDPTPRLEKRLPDLVRALEPDAIVFTGDAVNSPEGLPVFKDCVGRLAALAPTFAVLGNWDVRAFPGLDRYGGTAVKELDGTAVRLSVAGAGLWLAGVAVDEEQKIPAALEAGPAAEFRVFLHHYPDWIEEVALRKADLYLAGHTHGGQVALPLYGALVTLSRYGKRFESGLHRVRDTWLYVNRGIGMEGGPAPRVRFCSRPEITLLELSPD